MLYSASTKGFIDPSIHKNKIPEDSIEISNEMYLYLIDGQSNGRIISSDESGRPFLTDPQQPTATERRASAKRSVDTVAGNTRARYVSAGKFIDDEYKLTREQTAQWRSAGSPSDAVPMAVQAWADATGMTPEQAASDIERIADQWESVLMEIRRIRLLGKSAVDNAPDDADFAAIAQPFIDQLDAMGGE